MYLKTLKIKNFRNIENLEIELNKNINVFIGNNAQGKTSILESIYVLAFTRSHRIFSDDNLIMKNKKNCLISGMIDDNGIDNYLKIGLDDNKKNICLFE